VIKNQSGQTIGAQVINATTGAAFVGAVVVYVTGDGGTQAIGSVGAGACVAEGQGYFSYTPAAAETNYDHVAFTFVGTGAINATTQVATITAAQAGALAATSSSGMTVVASDIIIKAFKRIGVIAGTETPTADMAQDGLVSLNTLVDSWHIQRGTIQGIRRFTYALVASQGGPSNPYLIGVGQQFNQARPVWIDHASILFGTGTSAVELPLYRCITPDEYSAITMKDIESPFPTVFYYEGVGSGAIYLWPVASSALQSIALYAPVAVSQFADYATTAYTLLPGYRLALETNLAIQLLPEYPRAGYQVDPLLLKMATESLAYVKRSNTDPGLLRCDPALLGWGGANGAGGATGDVVGGFNGGFD
jgi:hypothetical protein